MINYCDELRINNMAQPQNYWSNTSSNEAVKRFIQETDKMCIRDSYQTQERYSVLKLGDISPLRDENTHVIMRTYEEKEADKKKKPQKSVRKRSTDAVSYTHLVWKHCRVCLHQSCLLGMDVSGVPSTVTRTIQRAVSYTHLDVYKRQPADILDEAVLYLRVYFVGFPFLFMYNICLLYTSRCV